MVNWQFLNAHASIFVSSQQIAGALIGKGGQHINRLRSEVYSWITKKKTQQQKNTHTVCISIDWFSVCLRATSCLSSLAWFWLWMCCKSLVFLVVIKPDEIIVDRQLRLGLIPEVPPIEKTLTAARVSFSVCAVYKTTQDFQESPKVLTIRSWLRRPQQTTTTTTRNQPSTV